MRACGRTELAPLSDAEQAEVRRLAQNLPAVWPAPTTQPVDRKRLLRLAITEITVTVDPTTRSADCVILWSGGAITPHHVQRPPLGWSCRTEPSVVDRIRELASAYPDHQMAARLHAEGIPTRTGKPWTYQRVHSMRKVYHLPSACPITPGQTTTRGDGLLSVRAAARLLQVSPSRGILVKDQRVVASKLWVRVNESDMARLDGSADATQLATIPEIMPARRLSQSEVWDWVRQGHYLAYRIARGRCWEWRLRPCNSSEQIAAPYTRSI